MRLCRPAGAMVQRLFEIMKPPAAKDDEPPVSHRVSNAGQPARLTEPSACFGTARERGGIATHPLHPILLRWLRLPWVRTDASTATTDGVQSAVRPYEGKARSRRIADRAPRRRTGWADKPPVHPDDRAADAPMDRPALRSPRNRLMPHEACHALFFPRRGRLCPRACRGGGPHARPAPDAGLARQ